MFFIAIFLPVSRILLIFRRYFSMSQIADQLYPVRSKQTPAEEFSEFTYWREPIPDIDELLQE